MLNFNFLLASDFIFFYFYLYLESNHASLDLFKNKSVTCVSKETKAKTNGLFYMAVANVDSTTVVPPTGADAVAPFDWAKVNSYDWLSLGALSMSTSKVEKLKEVLVALGGIKEAKVWLAKLKR